jgi:type IV secretion system protein VirB10
LISPPWRSANPAGLAKVAGAAASAAPVDRGETTEEKFAARIARDGVETVIPTALRDRALVAPQGTIIAAVMETAIKSDLPGYTRAIVSRDVRGFDGTTVLIPRGTRIIGQYRNALAVGQSRAFVIWSRLLTPQDFWFDIQSRPVTDWAAAALRVKPTVTFSVASAMLSCSQF